ncbi:MAG: DUF362 domain-containing protein [Acidobacteriales bacterium]|nr:DUF362 domain-containing protein [Terriglobales bacterium]
MTKSVVAVVRTSPDTVLDDIVRACELAGMEAVLDRRAGTILKDNISWHFPFPGANTTPWQLEGAILALRKHGFGQIACVQNKTVVTNAFKGEDLNHYLPVFRGYDIPVLYNFHDADMRWVEYKPKAKMLALQKIFPDGIRIPEYFVGKNIVHLPTVKCHIYTTTTGAMKNAFGGLLNTKRHYTHTWIHETLVDLLAIQKEIHTGLFAIMDGTTAGDGPGPRTMRPHVKNLILASSDQVAIDAVAAKVMGFDPLGIGYIRMASEQSLGVGDPNDISLVGDDIKDENWGFSVGDNLASMVGDICWFGWLSWAQKLLFRTPLVHLFVFGSECYHDWYRWPLKDRVVFERWLKQTAWGALFRKYASIPVCAAR